MKKFSAANTKKSRKDIHPNYKKSFLCAWGLNIEGQKLVNWWDYFRNLKHLSLTWGYL